MRGSRRGPSRRRLPLRKDGDEYALPAGGVEAGESFARAAIRVARHPVVEYHHLVD